MPVSVLDIFSTFCLYWSEKGNDRMSHDASRTRPPIYSQMDVPQAAFHPQVPTVRSQDGEVAALLRQLLTGQDKQNELLEELVSQVSANQRQRQSELVQWKQANLYTDTLVV